MKCNANLVPQLLRTRFNRKLLNGALFDIGSDLTQYSSQQTSKKRRLIPYKETCSPENRLKMTSNDVAFNND
jgi:hypothetical protein